MPPKRSTRGAAAKKTPSKPARVPAPSKVTKKTTKKQSAPRAAPTRSSARLRASSAALSDSVAGTSMTGGSQDSTSDADTALVTIEQETAIETIEEVDEQVDEEEDTDEQDGMPPSDLERALQSSPSSLIKLTKVVKQDLVLSMREEILRLRQTVEQMQQQQLQQQKLLQEKTAVSSPDNSPELIRKHLNRARDLRFQFTIAQPAAAAEKAAAERQLQIQAANVEAYNADLNMRSPESELPSSQEMPQLTQSSLPESPSPPTPAASTVYATSVKPRSPPDASSPWIADAVQSMFQTPSAPIPASPWGLRTMFSTAFKRAFGQNTGHSTSEEAAADQQQSQPSPSTQQTPQQPQHQSEPRTEERINLQSSPFSPSMMSMTPSMVNHHAPATPSARVQRSRRQQNDQAQQESPTSAQAVSNKPLQRRRGSMPGAPPRTPRGSAATPRRKPNPVEPNADKRSQILEHAAENKRMQDEQAAERKRIQEQASMLEEQKRIAESEQQKLDDDDVATQQAGNKRKRVRVDDLKAIPARLPGQSSGVFSFRPEFFEYDSDSDAEDYVEIDADEADQLMAIRPAKKMRMEDNVFQSSTPQKPTSSSAAGPSTPIPSSSQQQQLALEQQRLRTSQHKPKRPSGLRQVSSAAVTPASTGQTPRQISAATPAPIYYDAALNDITELTEPTETPAPPRTQFHPAAFTPASARTLAQAQTPAPVTAVATQALESENTFNFPAPVDLWVSEPSLFTPDNVRAALANPMTEAEINAAAGRFATGLAAWSSTVSAAA